MGLDFDGFGLFCFAVGLDLNFVRVFVGGFVSLRSQQQALLPTEWNTEP